MKESMIVYWILFGAMSLFIYLFHRQQQISHKLKDELYKANQTSLDLQRKLNDK
tara:strand:+ start:102 stop:263 length:162 start_codon:yes stop_codon:yes gene_type:complete